MYDVEICQVTDIPQIKRLTERPIGKQNKSKWYKIVTEFLESGEECIKITPYDITARNASIALWGYLKKHPAPVGYAKRGDSIYIFRKETTE